MTTRALKDLYPYYLAGRAVLSKDKAIPVLDKYTNKVATHVSHADDNAIRQAIQAASQAERPMHELGSFERKEILLNVAAELKARNEELAHALAIEVGKPIKDSRVEVLRAVDTFTYAAEESIRRNGEFNELDISARNKGFRGITTRFPIGLVSMIVPFNFPVNLAAHKIAPAIAAGCPFVMKPSERTPLSASILGDILSKQKLLPEGAFSILPTSVEHANIFSEDERIKMVSFTGSAEIGWKVKAASGKKKVTLELGGDAAVIVDEDTPDLELAADRIVFGAFYQSGQSCISVQRIFAHDKIYDQLKEKLIEKTKKVKRGSPLDEETFLGPLITENDAKRVEKWVNESKGKIIVGGKRDGSVYDATIVEGVDPKSDLGCREVFGPVCYLIRYSDFKTVIDQVNESAFGLQAGIFTSNINKAFYAYDRLHVGGVLINEIPSARVDSQPYGGIKDSGLGREGVKYAMEDMTELKIMMMKNIGQL